MVRIGTGIGMHYPGSTSGEIFNNYSEGSNIATGAFSHSEGSGTTAEGFAAHAEGSGTKANGSYSHAEGYRTTASGYSSHAEGSGTIASGNSSHAEGYYTTANGDYSHAEGYITSSIGRSSHAEGNNTKASGNSSHAEGSGTTASGDYSHAGGLSSSANGKASFSQGEYLLSQNKGEAALGVKNSSVFSSMLEGDLKARATLFSVGMGIDGTARNAMELKYNGDLYLYGAGNYDGRNSLGNAAYDSTVQTVQSLLSISSGNKIFTCTTDKTDLTKVANDESIPVEVGSVVTVLFQNGSSASTSTNSIYLNINGHQAQVVAPNNMNNSVGSFRMLPPYLDTGSILSFAYDGTRWIVVGNPLLATLTTFEDGFNFILEIYANRVMKYYISRENLQTGMSYSFGFPIPFSDFVSGICYGAANMALRTNTVNFTVSSGSGTDFYAIITGRI